MTDGDPGRAELPAGLLASVGAAVGLAEGARGVEDVIRAIARREAAPIRDVSRQTGIPVPVVAAIANELRTLGVVDRGRPARLTERGRQLMDRLGTPLAADPTCPVCGGLGITIPAEMREVAEQLEGWLRDPPRVEPRLDQSHCTVETKIRRVLHLLRSGALDRKSVLLLGDDDLGSLAVPLVGRALEGGPRLPERLVVVDVDDAVLEFAGARLREIGAQVELVRHDLRLPLPSRLSGAFDTVFTDPPYTVSGVRLFLSRAVASMKPGAGRQVFLCVGPMSPEDTRLVQTTIAGLGLAVTSLTRNFNEYLGAGVLAGTSNLYDLISTQDTRPQVTGEFTGPLYTGEEHARPRTYRCRTCGRQTRVGTNERHQTIGDLKRAGCPQCQGTTFRPGPLA